MRSRWQIVVLSIPVWVGAFAMAGGGIGDAAWMGMTVETLESAKAAQMSVPANAGHVVVVGVRGPALATGVIAGDVVVGINGQHVTCVSDFLVAASKAMRTRAPSGDLADVVLTLDRHGRTVTITAPGPWVDAFGSG